MTCTFFDPMERPVKVERLAKCRVTLQLTNDGLTGGGSEPGGIAVTGFDYDAARTASIEADGPIAYTETRYDFLGRVDKTRDAEGKWTKHYYDAAGRRWKTRAYVAENAPDTDLTETVATGASNFNNPITQTTLYGYDKNGNLRWTLARRASSSLGLPARPPLRNKTKLSRHCRDQVEIRLGIASGMVVVIADELPIGTGILRADKLSSYPTNWQICVNEDFWRHRSKPDKSDWKTVPVEQDADALLLVRNGEPSSSPVTPPPLLNPGARAVFAKVIELVSVVLKANPGLRADLEAALKSGDAKLQSDARDVVDVVFSIGLNEALGRIYGWLMTQNSRDDAGEIRELIEGLAAMGADPQWVTETRALLDSGTVEVPAGTEESAADMLVAALFDNKAHFDTTLKERPPKGRNHVPVSSWVEPAGTNRASILAEVKRNLCKVCGIPFKDDPASMKVAEDHLRQHLETSRRHLKRPFYTLLEQTSDAAVLSALKQDTGFDWRLLLVLSKVNNVDSKPAMVLPESHSTALLIQAVFDRLVVLEAKAKARGGR